MQFASPRQASTKPTSVRHGGLAGAADWLMLRTGRGPTTALLRRACSTTACLRAEIAALKAQLTSLGSVPAAPKPLKPGEQSFFAGAASEYTTELKFFQPHIDGALRPLDLAPTPTLGREPRATYAQTRLRPCLASG